MLHYRLSSLSNNSNSYKEFKKMVKSFQCFFKKLLNIWVLFNDWNISLVSMFWCRFKQHWHYKHKIYLFFYGILVVWIVFYVNGKPSNNNVFPLYKKKPLIDRKNVCELPQLFYMLVKISGTSRVQGVFWIQYLSWLRAYLIKAVNLNDKIFFVLLGRHLTELLVKQ